MATVFEVIAVQHIGHFFTSAKRDTAATKLVSDHKFLVHCGALSSQMVTTKRLSCSHI